MNEISNPQFNTNTPTPTSSDEFSMPARSWNRTAVLAAMFCIPFFCPPMTLVGVGTGAMALRSLRKNKDTKGAWLAWSAISVGVVATILSTWLFWISGLRTIVLGPTVALAPLFTSDPQGMKQEWAGPATELTQEQLAAFTLQVTSRYGKFVSAQVSDKRPTPLEQSWKRSMVVIPITIQFASGALEADLGLERFNEKTGKSSMVWRSLRIIDPTKGNMIFPEGEPPPPELPALDSGQPATILKPIAPNAVPQTG
jgi:hypothetical protein